MNKWQVSGASASAILIVVLVSTLYGSDYLKILAEHPSQNLILLDYSERERAELLLKPLAYCPYYLIRVDPVVLNVKCGSKVILVTDTVVGSKTSKWVNLTRNLSSVRISASEEGWVVRETDILKSGKFNGFLREDFSITQRRVKIGFEYTPAGVEVHRVGWRVKQNVGADLRVSDPQFLETAGNVHWYGGGAGRIEVDPVVVLAESNLTYYVWNGTSYVNVTNYTLTNFIGFPCTFRDVDCQPVYINLTRGNLTNNVTNASTFTGQNVTLTYNSTNVSIRNYTVTHAFPLIKLNNTGSLNISFVQTRLNDTCSFVNLTISNSSTGRRMRYNTSFVNVSGPINATVNRTVDIFLFLNLSYTLPTNFTNETRTACPPIEFIWEVS